MTMHKGAGDAYTYSPQTEAGLNVQQTSVRWNDLVHGPAEVPRCEQSVIYYKSPFMAPSDDADLSRYEPVEGGGFRIRDGKGCFTRPIIWGNNQIHGGDKPIFAMKTGTGSALAGFDAEHACFPIFGRSATGAWKQPYPLLGFLRLGVPGEDGPAWFHERDGVETITRPGYTQYHLDGANGVPACEITIAPLMDANGLVCRVRFERPQDLVWEYGDLYWDNGAWALIPEVNRNAVTIDGTTARLTEMNLGPALVLAGWDGTGVGEAIEGPLLDINNQGQIARFSSSAPREEYYLVAVWGVTGYDHALAEQMMGRLDSRNTAHWPEERDRLKQRWFDAFITPHLNPEEKFRTAMRDPAGELQRMKDWWAARTAQVQISTPDPYFNNLISWVHTTSHYHQLGPGLTNSGSASDSYGHISPGWWGKLWGGDVEAVKTNLRLYGAMQLDETTFTYADPNAVNRHYPVYASVDGCIPWICSSLEPAVRENNNPWFLDQVWWVYAWTGDAQFVRDLWPIIMRAVEWQCTINDPDGDGLFRDFYPFWAGDNGCEGPKGVVASALGWTTLDRAAKLAAVVGDAESAQAYRAYADKSKAAIMRELWNEEIGVLGARGMEGAWREHMQVWQEALAVELGVLEPEQARKAMRWCESHTGFEPNPGIHLLMSSDWWPLRWSLSFAHTGDTCRAVMAGQMTGDADLWWPYAATAARASYYGAFPGVNYGIGNTGGAAGINEQVDSTDAHTHMAFRGLFGIEPAIHEQTLYIRPAFPTDWHEASINTPLVEYSYTREGDEAVFTIRTPQPLKKVVRGNFTGETVTTSAETESVVRVKLGASLPYENPCTKQTLRMKPEVPRDGKQCQRVTILNEEDRPEKLKLSLPLTNDERKRQVMIDLTAHFNTTVQQMMRAKYRFDCDDVPNALRNFWGMPHIVRNAHKTCGPSQHKGLWPHPNTVDALTGTRFLLAPTDTENFPEHNCLLAVNRTEPFPYPTTATITIGRQCSQVWPLLQCWLSAMKTYIPNGEIWLHYETGDPQLVQLIPPYNVDTYYQHYSLRGAPVRTGRLVYDDPWSVGFDQYEIVCPHADALRIDADPTRVLKEIELRAVCTESIIALAGLTIIPTEDDK